MNDKKEKVPDIITYNSSSRISYRVLESGIRDLQSYMIMVFPDYIDQVRIEMKCWIVIIELAFDDCLYH